MFEFLKRKTKEETIEEERERLLKKYILECRKLGFKDSIIIERLRTIKVPEQFLQDNFQLNLIKQEVTMPKPKEEDYEEEDQEIEESEEDSDEAEEDSEEAEEKPKKKVVRTAKKEEEEPPKVSIIDIVRNHEERIRNLESAIFRLKAIWYEI